LPSRPHALSTTRAHVWKRIQGQVRSRDGKKLLAESGYGLSKGAQTEVLVSPSRLVQMLPKPMNEYIPHTPKAGRHQISTRDRRLGADPHCRRAGAGSTACLGHRRQQHRPGRVDPTGCPLPVSYSSKAIAPKAWNYCTNKRPESLCDDPSEDDLRQKSRDRFSVRSKRLTGRATPLRVGRTRHRPRRCPSKVSRWTQVLSGFRTYAGHVAIEPHETPRVP